MKLIGPLETRNALQLAGLVWIIPITATGSLYDLIDVNLQIHFLID